MKKLLSGEYRPVTIILGFNILTLVVFLTAPVHWAPGNTPVLVLLVLVSQFCIGIGFVIGHRRSKGGSPHGQILYRLSSRGQTIMFVLGCLTFPLKYAYLLRYNPSDFGGMFNQLMMGIRDPQYGYYLAINPINAPTVRWSTYLITSLVNQPFFIMGFICWKRYNAWKQIAFTTFLAIEIFYWMGIGTNVGVISLITVFLFTQLHRLGTATMNMSQTFKYGMILVVLLTGSITVFSYNLNARSGVAQVSLDQFDLGESKVNQNSGVFTILPAPLHGSYMFVVSYLAQGYHNASLAFDLDFKWTFFLGSNPALLSLAQAAGFDVWENTYMARLWSKGVDPFVQWHSAYTWFASDVTFFGVPVLLALFGYILGASWGLVTRYDDLLSNIVFAITANILLYLFANNSYLSSMFYASMAIFPIWWFTRIMSMSPQLAIRPRPGRRAAPLS